ncbi:hypothetical protein D9756_000170 [Leucocoprinus leucothites]|uniref:Arrestin-like N-terminal domain-containing protein n=1 Tax=Leucocoprinus leucothites TaxID=201217 RepID=A0A8H5LMW2_9AGAR|nr:hypothetical protein D9756_000170 [Leucoagaricus leucothites]
MNVHTIKLLLRGKAQVEEHSTSLPAATDHIFLDKSFYIFSKKASEDPRKSGRCEVSKNKEFDGTLHGSYSFPFTIPFPTSVEWRYPTQAKGSLDSQTKPVLTYETPPSFREKRVASAVVYELVCEVKHGALRSHSRTMTEIIFTPKKVSPPASEKRQIAYREDALLPWPLADPDGWHALPAVMIRGQYQSRPVEAKCILHLAKPVHALPLVGLISTPKLGFYQLSFTRGTIIPCFFSLSCHNFAFLEALATPHTINFHLFREIGHLVQTPLKEKGGKRANTRTTKRAHIAKAVWWKPPKMDTPPALTEIFLEGEVHLPKSLLSSCDFPLFMIEYTMELLPFTLASFTPTREFLVNGVSDAQGLEGEIYESLVKQVVDITNFHEFGPVPKPFTIPVTGELARGITVDDPSTTFSAFGSSLTGLNATPYLNAELPFLT